MPRYLLGSAESDTLAFDLAELLLMPSAASQVTGTIDTAQSKAESHQRRTSKGWMAQRLYAGRDFAQRSRRAMKRVRIPRYFSGSGVPRSEAVEVTSPIPLDLVGSIVFRLGVKSCPTAGLVVSATLAKSTDRD
jgi:hypothetical protein